MNGMCLPENTIPKDLYTSSITSDTTSNISLVSLLSVTSILLTSS